MTTTAALAMEAKSRLKGLTNDSLRRRRLSRLSRPGLLGAQDRSKQSAHSARRSSLLSKLIIIVAPRNGGAERSNNSDSNDDFSAFS